MLKEMSRGHPLVLVILVADLILGYIPYFLALFLLDMVIQLVFVLYPNVSVPPC